MSIFGKAKCLIGMHDYGNWKFVSEKKCEQVRYCSRDHSHTDARIEHSWSPYKYIEDGACTEFQVCARCDKREERVRHESWSDWIFVRPDDCSQEQKCNRCGEPNARVYHSWDVWVYASPTTCDQVRKCRRCPGEERKIATNVDHRWQAEKKINCNTMGKECERCRQRETRFGTFHTMGPWEQDHGRSHRQFRACSDCAYVEERS